jgi:ribosomal protein S18 acetylase RimI-like enzyme
MDLRPIQQSLPGCVVRPVQPGDVPTILDLTLRLTTAVLGEPDATEAEIRDDLAGPHFDIATDTYIALAPDGRAVSYGQGYDEHSGSGWVDAYLDPDLDDATFAVVADAVVGACRDRIVESARDRGAASIHVVANLYDTETRMREAYERAGIAVETIYWRMQRSLAPDVPLEAPALADGVRIAKVDPQDDAVIEVAFGLFHETFSEHHGHEDSQMGLADWVESKRTAESYDPQAWWFAYDGDEPVGLLIGDDRRVESGVGYIGSVGVVARERGRGIARALMLTAFADYLARGRTGVQLGVDSANTTGATRLYESVGMTSMHSALALGQHLTL